MTKKIFGTYKTRTEAEEARSYVYAKHGVVLDMEMRNGFYVLYGYVM